MLHLANAAVRSMTHILVNMAKFATYMCLKSKGSGSKGLDPRRT